MLLFDLELIIISLLSNVLFKSTDTSGSNNSDHEAGPSTSKAVKRSHSRSVKTGVTLTIPHDVIGHQTIVAHQRRTGATVSGTVSFLKTLIQNFATEGDISNVNFSYTHGYR